MAFAGVRPVQSPRCLSGYYGAMGITPPLRTGSKLSTTVFFTWRIRFDADMILYMVRKFYPAAWPEHKRDGFKRTPARVMNLKKEARQVFNLPGHYAYGSASATKKTPGIALKV